MPPERIGYRPPTEIDKEPPKEAPYITPSDQTGDTSTPPAVGDDVTDDTTDTTTPSTVGDDISDEVVDTTPQPLPRLEPLGPGDKEAARWNTEADLIEDFAGEVGDPDAYLKDVTDRVYEPSDSGSDRLDDTPPEIGEDIGGDDAAPDIDVSPNQEP